LNKQIIHHNMDHFKSFKGYLSSSKDSIDQKLPADKTSVPNSPTVDDTDNVEDEEKSKFKLFSVTNFNRMRNSSITSSHKPEKPSFLRSKSINLIRKDKSSRLSSEVFAPIQLPEGNYEKPVFSLLEKELVKLIEHFKPTELQSFESPLYEKGVPTGECSQPLLYLVSPKFLDSVDTSLKTFHDLATYAKSILNRCLISYMELERHSALFDYSKSVPSNGYRSLLKAFESCCKRMFIVVSGLNDTKNGFMFKLNKTRTVCLKDFQTWVRLMEKIEIVLQTALELQKTQLQKKPDSGFNFHAGPSLFYDLTASDEDSSLVETNLLFLGSVYQEAFFGRTCGFQFCDSLQTPLTGAAVALASYNDGYEAYSNKENQSGAHAVYPLVTAEDGSIQQASPSTGSFIGQATLFKSLVSGTKYIMDPELRAKKISKVMKDANVEFCKAFWQLTETDIVQMGSNLITPVVAVNILKKINLDSSLQLPKVNNVPSESVEESSSGSDDMFVTIDPPQSSTPKDTVQIRILSSEMRDGMQDLDNLKGIESPALFNSFLNFQSNSLNNFTPGLAKSSNLILHVHGGGFIAHSSKSHEIYLRPWCKELKVPIVSIDYSLAPLHVFPRASEECFYVYAWCLLNKDLLGWTGEKIICVGDSAGGVLVTNIVQRAIISQIRVPDVLIPIYTPFLSTYSLSPSRLMSVMDPLLNLGVLWRCLAAYCGIDYKKETERFKSMLDLPDSTKTSEKLKTSPTMTSILKTTPFRALLSRSNSANLVNNKTTQPNEQNVVYSKNSIDLNIPDKLEKPIAEKTDNASPTEEVKSPPAGEELTLKQKQRLLQLHKVLGDSVFLIERLRNHPLTQNQFMSPLLTDQAVLAKFPKTYLITTAQDPLLDDNIEFNQKLNSLNVACKLHVLNGLHHGFLNFITASKDCLKASKYVAGIIKHTCNPPPPHHQ